MSSQQPNLLSERLTYAELDYVLARYPGWPARRARFAFPVFEDSAATTTAGLTSLMIRGLTTIDAGEVITDEPVRVLSIALAEAETFVYLSRAEGDALSLGMVGIDQHPMLISVIAPGCLELVALDSRKAPEELIAGVVKALAGEDEVLGVAAPGLPPVLIGRLGDEWLLGGDPDRGDPGIVDEAAVVEAISRIVEQARLAADFPA